MCLLQDFCCCCSLSTGVLFISVINLLLSFFPYLYGTDSDLVKNSAILSKLDDYSVHELSCFYYAITASVAVAALFSVLSSSRWLLFPLHLWDVLRLVVILEIVIRTFGKGSANANVWIIAVLLLYCISVEYSYRKELADGHRHDGMMLAQGTTVSVCTHTVTAPSAPPGGDHHQYVAASTVVSVPDEYNVQSPYAKSCYPAYQPQPPYPLSAPAASVYPPQPYSAGASAPPPAMPYPASPLPAGSAPFAQGAPPPYPAAQSQLAHENPPPYAP